MEFPREREQAIPRVVVHMRAEPQLLPPEGEVGGQRREAENLELTCEGSGGAA